MIDEGAHWILSQKKKGEHWIITPPMFISILELCADFGLFSPFHVVWDVNIVRDCNFQFLILQYTQGPFGNSLFS